MNLRRTADCLPLIHHGCDKPNLLCPECGNEWLHLDGVHVEHSRFSLCEGKRAIERCKIQPAGWGSGPSIRIALWCEEGHHSWFDLVEHEGKIFVERFKQDDDETTRKPFGS